VAQRLDRERPVERQLLRGECPPPARPVGVEVCLDGNSTWATPAAEWLTRWQTAREHQAATRSLKDHVEDDAARAFGHGIEVKAQQGALTTRELQA
jgi:hypothetical protein